MPRTFKAFEGNTKLGVPIAQNHYAGGGHVGDDRPSGLSNVIRGLAIDHARLRVISTAIADFTDSSTGTPSVSGVNVALTVPAAAFDAQSAGGSPAAAFDTAVDIVENAMAVMADTFNEVAAILGLRQITFTTGTVATADTIPAMTKVLAATSGATAIDFTTGAARMTTMRNNYSTLHRAMNQISNALGLDTIADNSGGAADTSKPPVLAAVANATAGTGTPAGATSVSDAVMDTFLTAIADNVATLAKHYSDMFSGSGIADVTNSVGGSATDAVADMGTMTAHQDVATNSSPKAAFDLEIAKWRKDFAEVIPKLNALGQPHNLTDLIDNTAGTADGTADAILVALTAVDGTANVSLEAVSALATWDAVKANVATIIARINELVGFYGGAPIVDSSTGVASATFDVVAMADSGAGVDNGAAVTGVADAEVDANLVVLRNALTSIVGKSNEMTGTFEGVAKIGTGFPLCVVAAA